MKITSRCLLCEDCGWVCESYPDKPWEGPHACLCGAPGAPCPACNASNDGNAPRMPADSRSRSTKAAGGIELVHPLSRSHLEDSARYIQKLPKAQRDLPHWQGVVEHGAFRPISKSAMDLASPFASPAVWR